MKPFSCPSNTNNQCNKQQISGFDWADLTVGSFSSYGGLDFSGFSCSNSFGSRKRSAFVPRGGSQSQVSAMATPLRTSCLRTIRANVYKVLWGPMLQAPPKFLVAPASPFRSPLYRSLQILISTLILSMACPTALLASTPLLAHPLVLLLPTLSAVALHQWHSKCPAVARIQAVRSAFIALALTVPLQLRRFPHTRNLLPLLPPLLPPARINLHHSLL